MPVLSNVDIEKIMKRNKGIIIMNMRNDNLTALGYDFSIGFICNSDTGEEPKKIECIYDKESHKEYKKEEFIKDRQLTEEYEKHKEEDRYKFIYRYELLPRERYLVISTEYVALLRKYMATLHSRGSYALKGILVTSTTLDPNYCGFIYGSLINCSKNPVYIKEHNQFVTMVVQKLATATDKSLPTTEGGMPKDAEQTLNGTFSNVCEKTVTAAKMYKTDAQKKIEREFKDRYAAFRRNPLNMICFVDWFSNAKQFLEKIIFKKGFWMWLLGVFTLIYAWVTGNLGKVAKEILQLLSQ